MTCCLTVPSHYLIQCRFITGWISWYSCESISMHKRCKEMHKMLIHKMSLKYTLVKLLPHLSGASEWSHGNLVPGQISGNPDWCGQVHVSSWFVERQWSGMPSYHDGCYTDHSRYINPHLAEICLTHIKYVFVFPIVFQHCDEGGGWNCSCWKIRNHLFNMFYN